MNAIDWIGDNVTNYSPENFFGGGIVGVAKRYIGSDGKYHWKGEDDASLAFRRNVMLMDYQNAYNSPAQTMQRLVDAGVNPFVAAQGLAGYNNSASFTATGGAQQYAMNKQNMKIQKANAFISAFSGVLDMAGKLVGVLESGGSLQSRILKNQADAGTSYLDQLLKNEQLLDVRSLADYYADYGSPDGGLQSVSVIPYTSRVKGAAPGLLGTERSSHYNEASQRRINELNGLISRSLKSNQVRKSDYEYNELLPLIKKKYELSNEQSQYLVRSLETFSPEVRSFILMLLSVASVF